MGKAGIEMFEVRIYNPQGNLKKIIPPEELVLLDENPPPKKKYRMILVTCPYCQDKVRVRQGSRGICKKTSCEGMWYREKGSRKKRIEDYKSGIKNS